MGEVSESSEPHLASAFPYGGRKDGYYQYMFHVPGIGFHLFVGQRIPTIIRGMCTVRSPERFLYVSPMVDESLVRAMVRAMPNVKPTGTLKKSAEVPQL